MGLAQKLADIRARMDVAAQKAGRRVEDITLVGVTKTASRPEIEEAYRLGLLDFGENRIPDVEEKYQPLPYPAGAARLHLIGHLQTNKARRAVALGDIIHAVDSVKLAGFISRVAQEHSKVMPVLLEVNVAGELSKFGFSPAELASSLAEISQLPNLELRGLMTIAPFATEPETARPVFAGLRQLFEDLRPPLPAWRDLSMGMSNDFEVAIQEGATMIRVGRALFS